MIRKSEFVTKTQFFYRYREDQLNCLRTLIINVLSCVSRVVKLRYFNYFLLFIIFALWIQKYGRLLWCNVNKHNAELCWYSSRKLLPMVIKENCLTQFPVDFILNEIKYIHVDQFWLPREIWLIVKIRTFTSIKLKKNIWF